MACLCVAPVFVKYLSSLLVCKQCLSRLDILLLLGFILIYYSRTGSTLRFLRTWWVNFQSFQPSISSVCSLQRRFCLCSRWFAEYNFLSCYQSNDVLITKMYLTITITSLGFVKSGCCFVLLTFTLWQALAVSECWWIINPRHDNVFFIELM